MCSFISLFGGWFPFVWFAVYIRDHFIFILFFSAVNASCIFPKRINFPFKKKNKIAKGYLVVCFSLIQGVNSNFRRLDCVKAHTHTKAHKRTKRLPLHFVYSFPQISTLIFHSRAHCFFFFVFLRDSIDFILTEVPPNLLFNFIFTCFLFFFILFLHYLFFIILLLTSIRDFD